MCCDVPPQGSVVPGLYVSGWLKRGPSGIIGTNIADARETAKAVVQDVQAGTIPTPQVRHGMGWRATWSMETDTHMMGRSCVDVYVPVSMSSYISRLSSIPPVLRFCPTRLALWCLVLAGN